MKGGIYMIKNLINDKFYIGSSNNIIKRWSRHKDELKRGIHHSKYLQNAYDKYGKQNFEWLILSYEFEENLINSEQIYIDCYNPCYNMCKTAKSCLGVKRSKFDKNGVLKIGNRKGVKLSSETCQRISKSKKGIKQSLENIKKRLNSRIGKIRTISEQDKQKWNNIYINKNPNIFIGRCKIINQFTLEGEFVKSTTSTEIKLEKKFSFSAIKACLLGKNKSSQGYIWKYKQNEKN